MKSFQHLKLTLVSGVFGLSLNGLAMAVPLDLVETLGDEDFQQREAAQEKLSAWAKGKGKETFNEFEQLKQSNKSPEVKMRLDNVMEGMAIYEPIAGTRGFIGVTMNPMLGAVMVRSVHPGTPAEKKGLKVGDEIIKVDKTDLTKFKVNIQQATNFFSDYVKKKNAGDKLTLKIRRGDEEIDIELKLGDYDKLMKMNNMGNIAPWGGPLNPRLQQIPKFKQNQFLELELQQGFRLELGNGGNNQRIQPEKQLAEQDQRILELQKQLRARMERERAASQRLMENLGRDLMKMSQEQGGVDKLRIEELLKGLNGEKLPEPLKEPHAEPEIEPEAK